MTVEIDKAGRIVVPKKLRDAMHLVPGTQLQLEQRGNTLILEPELPQARLVIENGFPVIYPAEGREMPVHSAEFFDTLLDQIRAERDRHNQGLYDDEIKTGELKA